MTVVLSPLHSPLGRMTFVGLQLPSITIVISLLNKLCKQLHGSLIESPLLGTSRRSLPLRKKSDSLVPWWSPEPDFLPSFPLGHSPRYGNNSLSFPLTRLLWELSFGCCSWFSSLTYSSPLLLKSHRAC